MSVRAVIERAVNEKRKILTDQIAKDIPGFAIKSKEKSYLWDILARLMFWNKAIKTHFITTLYPVVWVPQLPWLEKEDTKAVEIIAHEYVHLQDRKRLGYLFNLLYISPQIFTLLALLAVYNSWFLLFLGCLLPLPSPGRAWLEFRGYRMSMAVYHWFYGAKLDTSWIAHQFTGANYYWMFPFEKCVINLFDREYEKIKDGVLTKELKDVKIILDL